VTAFPYSHQLGTLGGSARVGMERLEHRNLCRSTDNPRRKKDRVLEIRKPQSSCISGHVSLKRILGILRGSGIFEQFLQGLVLFTSLEARYLYYSSRRFIIIFSIWTAWRQNPYKPAPRFRILKKTSSTHYDYHSKQPTIVYSKRLESARFVHNTNKANLGWSQFLIIDSGYLATGEATCLVSAPSCSCPPEVAITHPHQLDYPLATPQDLANLFFPIFSSLPGYTLRNLQYTRLVSLSPHIVLLGPSPAYRYTYDRINL